MSEANSAGGTEPRHQPETRRHFSTWPNLRHYNRGLNMHKHRLRLGHAVPGANRKLGKWTGGLRRRGGGGKVRDCRACGLSTHPGARPEALFSLQLFPAPGPCLVPLPTPPNSPPSPPPPTTAPPNSIFRTLSHANETCGHRNRNKHYVCIATGY